MRRIAILLFFPLYFIGSVPFLLIAMAIKPFQRNLARHIAYGFTRSTSIILMWLMGTKFVVTGKEHIDPHKNFLFVSNHRSLLDTPVLKLYSKAPLSFVSKMEMAKVPILKQWMDVLHCLFIDRDDNRKALKTILTGIEYLKLGDNMAIFPQGTRSEGDEFLPFKAGSFKLATKSQVPILPVCICGTDNVLENNVFNVKVCHVYVHFFEPIETAGLTMEAQKSLPEEVSSLIKAKYNEFKQEPF